jgi:DNA-binding response OmpR family regulator
MVSEITPPGSTILIVEDDPLLCDIMAILLRIRGYDVIQAYDGVQAITAIDRHLPPAPPLSLILLDAHLPVLDGDTLLAYLHKRHLDVPVIAISADPEALATLHTHGAETAIEKPLDLNQFLWVVQHHVQRRAS